MELGVDPNSIGLAGKEENKQWLEVNASEHPGVAARRVLLCLCLQGQSEMGSLWLEGSSRSLCSHFCSGQACL
uniref:Uncharacterized protein n=1 Tax=Calidris pygmaea TaxID=425635 RepID=A0A8C3K465_9CHAR